MRRAHTRYTDPEIRGGTVQRSLRLPGDLVEDVILEIAGGIPDIHTLTDAVTDALWLWRYEKQRMAGMEVGTLAEPKTESFTPAEFTQPLIQEGDFKETIEGGDYEEIEATYPASPIGRPSFAGADLPASDGT